MIDIRFISLNTPHFKATRLTYFFDEVKNFASLR